MNIFIWKHKQSVYKYYVWILRYIRYICKYIYTHIKSCTRNTIRGTPMQKDNTLIQWPYRTCAFVPTMQGWNPHWARPPHGADNSTESMKYAPRVCPTVLLYRAYEICSTSHSKYVFWVPGSPLCSGMCLNMKSETYQKNRFFIIFMIL